MSDEPVPMNTPVVAASAALASIGIAAESPEEQDKLNEQFKEAVFAHFEQITGLTFDRESGECTTQTDVRMEGRVKERWIELCGQLGAEQDPKQVEQLWREAGSLLRGAIETTKETTAE